MSELGLEIHELAIRAYPDIPVPSRDRLERNHFIDSVESQSIREGVYRARPSSLDEAIQAAIETENFEKIEMQRRSERMRPTRFSRALNQGADDRLQQMESILVQRSRRMEDILNQQTEQMEALAKVIMNASSSAEKGNEEQLTGGSTAMLKRTQDP